MKLIHGGNLVRRCQYMASFVKKGDVVLEPACGSAFLAKFLPDGSFYRGFDNNKSFIEDVSKKYPDVYVGDVLDLKNYYQADVVVACDILHHLDPINRERFVEYCFQTAKKALVICDPFKKKIPFEPLVKLWFEHFEQDGTNKPKLENFWGKETLKNKIENGFGVIGNDIEREVKEMGYDLIVTYFKKPKE